MKTYFTLQNSEEVEWMSILDGLEFAHRRKAMSLELENDNLNVINSIIASKIPKSQNSKLCFSKIRDIAQEFDWLGIRWIPRTMNKADRIFR